MSQRKLFTGQWSCLSPFILLLYCSCTYFNLCYKDTYEMPLYCPVAKQMFFKKRNTEQKKYYSSNSSWSCLYYTYDPVYAIPLQIKHSHFVAILKIYWFLQNKCLKHLFQFDNVTMHQWTKILNNNIVLPVPPPQKRLAQRPSLTPFTEIWCIASKVMVQPNSTVRLNMNETW